MSATFTFDVFSTLDSYGSPAPDSGWGGYWGKQGPEFLDHRASVFGEPQRTVFGAETYRSFAHFLATEPADSDVYDPWVTAMLSQPMTVISSTLDGPLETPSATVERGDAAQIVARLKEESDVPLLSHGSLSLNRALMAAGLVDRVRVTVFPVITGQGGGNRIFDGAADFDLELLDSRTFDGNIQELTYAPTLHA